MKQTNIGEAMKVILYSNHCPQCIILEKILKSKNVDYDIFTDENEMIKLGFTSMPMLSVDGKLYNFRDAYNLINSMGD